MWPNKPLTMHIMYCMLQVTFCTFSLGNPRMGAKYLRMSSKHVAFMCIVFTKTGNKLVRPSTLLRTCFKMKQVCCEGFVTCLLAAWVNAVWVKLHVPLSDTSGTSTTAVKCRREKIHLFLQQPVVLVFNTQTLKTQHEPICYLLPRHKLFSLSAEW